MTRSFRDVSDGFLLSLKSASSVDTYAFHLALCAVFSTLLNWMPHAA